LIEVVSIRFKNRGKSYTFAPNGLNIRTGDRVIVETAKGLEIAECSHGNHTVEDTAVVQPLRPVARIATADDLRIAELNKKREKEAFQICQQKIAEHGLEMKLVDVECNFEGNKTLFFFTADGRVDFRELVKDLAGIFRNRIELRQIGVRDEAKMIGGIGICGRPYCCSQFLEDFQPVSTKMAKIQSLSLNPTKISGSCGRLMCCLRYEQEAYEDLIKKVPKQGAFVETIDGYGTAAQVNLLRQTVKVKLDADKDDTLHLYKANELAAVPGGRPRDGEEPPHVLNYVPEETEETEEPEDVWAIPAVPEPVQETEPVQEPQEENRRSRRRRGGRGKGKGESPAPVQEESPAAPAGEKKQKQPRPARKKAEAPAPEQKPQEEHKKSSGRRHSHVKAVKAEDKAAKAQTPKEEKPPKAEKAPKGEGEPAKEGRRGGNRRRRPRGKGKPGGENKGTAE
jgi:cell fate regulator YaaT (PSP1 superfamily)